VPARLHKGAHGCTTDHLISPSKKPVDALHNASNTPLEIKKKFFLHHVIVGIFGSDCWTGRYITPKRGQKNFLSI
jgi:hypothetical protein